MTCRVSLWHCFGTATKNPRKAEVGHTLLQKKNQIPAFSRKIAGSLTEGITSTKYTDVVLTTDIAREDIISRIWEDQIHTFVGSVNKLKRQNSGVG